MMGWKIHVSLGKPVAKIVWDNTLYRTAMYIDNVEVTHDDKININIGSRPKLKIDLIAENIGDDGYLWGVIAVKNSYGKIVPLIVKMDLIKTGGIIYVPFSVNVDINFFKYIIDVLGPSGEYEIVGYVGHGDLISELRYYNIDLPIAYVRDVVSGIVKKADNEVELIKIIEDIISGVENVEYGPVRVVSGRPVIDIMSVMPIDLRQYGIKVRAADAGINFYEIYTSYRNDFTRSGVALPYTYDYSVLAQIADDSTEEVKK